MYPGQELNHLALRKAALRRGIALRRVHLTAEWMRVTRPVAWVDRLVAIGRRLSPLVLVAALPLGRLVVRSLLSRLKSALFHLAG